MANVILKKEASNTIDKKICKIIIFLAVLFCVFFPHDALRIKLLFIILAMTVAVLLCSKEFGKAKYRLLIYFTFILPVLLMIVSTIMTFNPFLVFQRSYFMFMPLLVFPIIKFKIDFKKLFSWTIFLLAIFSVGNVLLDILGILDIYSNPVLMYFHNANEAMIGKGQPEFTLYFLLFFKASPLLLLAALYFFDKKKYIKAIICVIALLLSGTRANIFMTVIILYVYFFFKANKSRKVIIALLTAVFITIAGMFIFDFIYNSFVMREAHDAVRDGHLESILRIFSENPIAIFFGTGLGSEFFTTGTNSIQSVVELSYWDLWRQIGLFGLLGFMFFLFYPLIKMRKKYWLFWGSVGYLVIAYTNPLLFSTTAYILYILIYSEYYKMKLYGNRRAVSAFAHKRGITRPVAV